eukprot:gene16966-20184_t
MNRLTIISVLFAVALCGVYSQSRSYVQVSTESFGYVAYYESGHCQSTDPWTTNQVFTYTLAPGNQINFTQYSDAACSDAVSTEMIAIGDTVNGTTYSTLYDNQLKVPDESWSWVRFLDNGCVGLFSAIGFKLSGKCVQTDLYNPALGYEVIDCGQTGVTVTSYTDPSCFDNATISTISYTTSCPSSAPGIQYSCYM